MNGQSRDKGNIGNKTKKKNKNICQKYKQKKTKQKHYTRNQEMSNTDRGGDRDE